jgi:protein-S-isoprenylcysteine O-methyltransferase Ste14
MLKKIFIPPVLLGISLILAIVFHYCLKDFNFIPFPYNLSGILIIIIGFSILGKARTLFSKYKTTFTFEDASFLINEGIFNKTRNPVYLGMCIFLLGVSVCFGNLFSLLMPLILFLTIEFYFIPMEEKMLANIFGEKYNEYKKRVRRWF